MIKDQIDGDSMSWDAPLVSPDVGILCRNNQITRHKPIHNAAEF